MSDSAVCEALREKENGNGFFKNGKFEESIVCYSRAITLCDATEEAQLSVLYSNRAFAKLKLKRYLTSIDDATQSFLLNNEYSKPLFHRYKARLALGHLQEALYDINGVCILEGEKVNIKEHERARDELLLDLSAIKIPEFVQNLPKLNANDRIIKDVFKDFRNHALFDELYDAEKITKFLSILENSPNIVNRKAKIYLTKAIICFFNQEGTEAEKFADVAVKSVQKDIKLKVTAMIHWANSKMATPLYRLNSILSAELLKIYEDAILLDKDNIDIYYHRAYCYLYLKLYDKMLTELERCIAMDSTFEAPHFLKFAGRYSFDDSICVNAIEMQKMFQQFDQYIRDHPDSTDAPIHYSKILEESGESKKALEVIHKALQQNPDNATLLVQKAKRIIAQNPEASRPILLQALNLNYAYKMELFMMLAIVESYDGKLKSAVTYCDKAMAETRNEDDIFHCAALREQMSSALNTLKLLGFHNEQQISSYCRNVFQEKKRKLLHSSAFKRFS